MKFHHSKSTLVIVVLCTLLVGVFVLTGCAGRGSLSSEIIDETNAYKVTADDASKNSAVGASGGFIVEEGQIVVVSPDIQKGSLQIKLSLGTQQPAIDEKINGHVLSSYEIVPGDYAISTTCNEDGTTGTVLIVAVDKTEFEKQNADLEATLAAALPQSESAQKAS